MYYNGVTDGQDICTLADDLAGSNDTSFKINKKTRFANWALRQIWGWIFTVYGGWKYDDGNQVDLPELTADLEVGRRFYGMPDGSADLFAVSYKDAQGNWHKMFPITEEQILERGVTVDEFEEVNGNPTYYLPVSNGFFILPASDTAREESLKVEISRDVVSFDPADTSVAPGFDSVLHEAVSVFMALQYSITNELPRAASLQKQWDGNFATTGVEGGYMRRVKEHYRTKFRQNSPGKIRHRRDIAAQYQ